MTAKKYELLCDEIKTEAGEQNKIFVSKFSLSFFVLNIPDNSNTSVLPTLPLALPMHAGMSKVAEDLMKRNFVEVCKVVCWRSGRIQNLF